MGWNQGESIMYQVARTEYEYPTSQRRLLQFREHSIQQQWHQGLSARIELQRIRSKFSDLTRTTSGKDDIVDNRVSLITRVAHFEYRLRVVHVFKRRSSPHEHGPSFSDDDGTRRDGDSR